MFEKVTREYDNTRDTEKEISVLRFTFSSKYIYIDIYIYIDCTKIVAPRHIRLNTKEAAIN